MLTAAIRTRAARPVTAKYYRSFTRWPNGPFRPIAGEDYPGYPLLANGSLALAWFLGGLPVLIVLAWWRSRRPPQLTAHLIKIGGQA